MSLDTLAISFNSVISEMRPSATLAMTARAKELKSAGRPIIGLSAGEPDFDTPDSIRAAAKDAIDEGFTHYTLNAGIIPLREEICKALRQNRGLDFSPQQILCSNGAKQSVAQAIYVLAGAGDEVLIPAPYWVSYPEMVRLSGATPVTIETTVADSYKLTPGKLREAITDRTRVLVLCSPSNPTGAVYSREELEGLANVLQEFPQVTVISDEIYEHIVYDIEFVSLGTLEQLRDRVVTVNGFSKGFAMTGWRLGYMAGDVSIVKAAAKLQSQLTSAPSSISQRAGVAALQLDKAEIDQMVTEFKRRRNRLLEWAASDPKITCPTPDGAFYIFPDMSAYLGTRTAEGREIQTSTDLCMYILEEHDVALVPGDAFGFPGGVRISYAAAFDDLVEASKRIQSGLARLS